MVYDDAATNMYIKYKIKTVKITHSFVNLTCFLELYGDADISFSVKYDHYPGK